MHHGKLALLILGGALLGTIRGQIPEPASLAVVMIAGGALLLGRRQA